MTLKNTNDKLSSEIDIKIKCETLYGEYNKASLISLLHSKEALKAKITADIGKINNTFKHSSVTGVLRYLRIAKEGLNAVYFQMAEIQEEITRIQEELGEAGVCPWFWGL